MLFNVALAAIFIGLLDAEAWLLVRILPEKKQPDDASVPRYLDDAALENPPLALANAARETLRMGDTVEAMLRDVMTALMNNDRALASRRVADGQCRRPPQRGDQALHHQADARLPRRARGPPRHGDRVVHHQSRAYRRHHRQESERARRQEDQAALPVLPRRRGRADRVPQARLSKACRPPSASS